MQVLVFHDVCEHHVVGLENVVIQARAFEQVFGEERVLGLGNPKP